MKKLLILLLSIMLLVMTACTGNKEDDEGHDGVTPVPDEHLVWNSDVDVYLISENTGDWRVDFVDKFSQGTGGIALIGSNDEKSKKDHEIVIGSSTREVSRLAYEELEKGMTSDSDAEGYVIYAHEGSIAIAYSSDASMKPSITAFLDNCLAYEQQLVNGVVLSDFYSQRVRAEENRLKAYDAHLAIIKEDLVKRGYDNADEIVASLKKLYSLYDTDMLVWLANLYDKDIGGFYYSNSGRDNLGYFPDLESTAQAFAMLDRSGLFDDFGGLKQHGVPSAIRETMLPWLLSLQSSEDGYFYHPQWGTAIGSSRRGRDLDNARSLFSYLKAKPYYDEPGGQLEGTLGAPGADAAKPASRLISPLGTSADFSAVIPATTTLPYYLQSLDAWAEYLEKINVSRDSYSVGNSLASDWSLIKAAGPEYVEYVINHLNERQIPETGLWEYNTPDNDYDPTDGIGFNGTNGLMKLCVLYGSLGYAVPNAYNALLSAIKVGLYTNTPEKNETVCYVLNIWTCIGSMLNNVEMHDPDNYPAARALVMEKAPALIESSYEILKPHLMEDGGFCYFEEIPMNISQGAIVGCAEWLESDINATMVATSSTIGALTGALKIPVMPIWYADDYYVFMDAFENVSSVVKKPKPGIETFESYNTESPVRVDVADGDEYEIVTHAGSLYGGKALRISSDGNSSAEILIDTKNKLVEMPNRCYFLEADFLVDSAAVGELMRFAHTDADGAPLIAVTLECYEDGGEKYLRLVETYEGLDGVKQEIKSGITLGEWHRIRIVSNKLDRTVDGEKKLDIYSKILIDDQHVMKVDSSTTEGGCVVDKVLSRAEIELTFNGETEIYFDNLLSEKKDLPYTG